MKEILLSQNQIAKVDDEDYELLKQYSWYAKKWPRGDYYVIARIKGEKISMHRFLMGNPKDKIVDHWDHDGLNNQRHNLRICTHGQNMQNSKKTNGMFSSNYKGVRIQTKVSGYSCFRSVIAGANGEALSLGSFQSEIEAAKAYDKAAKEIFGEFAYLNFPNI